LAQEAFRIAGNKLAIKTKLVSRRGLDENWRS
jgi:large subunit ribosomal protein L16